MHSKKGKERKGRKQATLWRIMCPHHDSGLMFPPPHDGENKVRAEDGTKDHKLDLVEIHKPLMF
jgi:hypothetical protein